MKYQLAIAVLLSLPTGLSAQTYSDSLIEWRNARNRSLMTGSFPMGPSDTEQLQYFRPDTAYRVTARFSRAKSLSKENVKKWNGKGTEPLRQYGFVDFELLGSHQRLTVYEQARGGDTKYYELFIPFGDPTNGDETFRAGRYLNLSVAEIQGNKVVIDFNKSFNPHSAYVRAYPSLEPPRENRLTVEVRAGEKAYGTDPGF